MQKDKGDGSVNGEKLTVREGDNKCTALISCLQGGIFDSE